MRGDGELGRRCTTTYVVLSGGVAMGQLTRSYPVTWSIWSALISDPR